MYVCVCHAHSIRKIKFEVFFYEQENDSLVGGNSMGQPSSKQV